uniref:protein disulfide-isomerase n=1 Tax=Albugo laibachii Nc14 TaxID=890382 RepID=F0VZ94_9STRA|nr:disulfideisomerase putative [Albugo laibachii Nc14]|eukprot:CCA14124.1 disulfideisomerase putative [Albugo laibachii Nc14]
MQIRHACRVGSLLTFAVLLSTVCGLFSPKDPIKHLDTKSFRNLLKSKGVWIVKFYAPWCGHCKQLAPEWAKAAKALDGVVNVAAVDCDQHKDLAAKYGVQGFPTIKIFGQDKSKPKDYQGPRDSNGIVQTCLQEASSMVRQRTSGKSKKKTNKKDEKKKESTKKADSSSKRKKKKSDVITLTDKNFDSLVLQSGEVWMVEFYAPWCGHCKKLAPEWEKAASDLKGSVMVGAIDATVHKEKAAEYGLKGFPMLKVFGPNAASAKDATDYAGERTADAITNFALAKVQAEGGGLKIKEFYSEDALTSTCVGKSSCVIAFLPHITDGGKTARENYINVLQEVSKLVRGKPFRFGWIQGGDQPEMELGFELSFGFPSLIAVSLERKRYVVQRGAFAAPDIADFLDGLLHGRESTTAYKELPSMTSVTPWDGKDVKLDPIEEDSMDEDIMSEILGAGDKDEL